MKIRAAITIIVSAFLTVGVHADTIHVPADYSTIQEAIDASSAGDEIVLAQGDYFEGFDLAGTSNITIRSTDPADPDVVAATVVRPASFILIPTTAASPTVNGLTFQHPDGDYLRILRLLGDADTTVSNCQFINSGIYFFLVSNATILDCTFRDIQISNGAGGAMFFQGGGTFDVRVERCRFIDIQFDEGHGTAFFLNSTQGSVSFNDCDFIRNSIGFMPDSTGGWGRGGVVGYLHYSIDFEPMLNVTINNCRFLGNSCESSHADNFAAGCTLGLGDGSPDENDLNVAVSNCIFVGNIGCQNTVSIGGGNSSDSSWLINSTFVANEPVDNVMRLRSTGSEFPVSNCISRDNISDLNVWTSHGVSYSNLDGESRILGAHVGNIDADALFVRQPDPGTDGVWGTIDDDYGNLRLTGGSPSIDAGSNELTAADFFDLDNDGDVDEPMPFDLRGKPRFADDLGMPDFGEGESPIVDHGAYEFRKTSPGAALTRFEVTVGEHLRGDETHVFKSDNKRLKTKADVGSGGAGAQRMFFELAFISPLRSPEMLELVIESKMTDPGGTAKVFLKNWTTGELDRVGVYAIGRAEQIVIIKGLDPSRYVRGNGRVIMEIRHIVTVPQRPRTVKSKFDLVKVAVR